MIARYANDKLVEVWSEESKYRRWALLECLWVDSVYAKQHGGFSFLPLWDWAASVLQKAGSPGFASSVRVAEKETRHDVRAFLQVLYPLIPVRYRPLLHVGLTSSDVVDTALEMAIAESTLAVKGCLNEVKVSLEGLKTSTVFDGVRVMEYTHGQPAETVPVSCVFDRWFRLVDHVALPEVVVKWGGPVGSSFQSLSNQEDRLLLLGARERFVELLDENNPALLFCVSEKASQTLDRRTVSDSVYQLWKISSSLAKVAQDLRFWHLRGFIRGSDCSSSSMAGKKNPADLEKVQGMERLVLGYLVGQLSSALIWENRDVSHSCVDRVSIPDAFHAVVHQAEVLHSYLVYSRFDTEALQAAAAGPERSRHDRQVALQLEGERGYIEAWQRVFLG